jgi:hypothetical protein
MTGQVKEEVIARVRELGVQVQAGCLEFSPLLLRRCEFLREPGVFHGFDVHGRPFQIELPPESLAFGYCGTPIVYHWADSMRLELRTRDGARVAQRGTKHNIDQSAEVFARSGSITRIDVWLDRLGWPGP